MSPRVLLVALLAFSGCETQAPRYVFAPTTVQALKDAGSTPMRLGEFTSAPDARGAQRVPMRASYMASPYGGFADYLKEALHQELTVAGRLSPDATIDVSGTLLKNVMDTTGMVEGDGELQARIVVRRGTAIAYDRVIAATITWDSNFVAAIAIPRAIAAYPGLVQRFVAALAQDPDFLAATR